MKSWILPFAALFLLFTACQSDDSAGGSSAATDSTATAQEEAPEEQLKSPPDSTRATLGDLTVQLKYGSPSVRGRQIWGELVPFGEIWRTGANEATTLRVSREVTINDQSLPAGTYALFTIPGEESWTVILNADAEQWGAYEYNEEEDVLRFDVSPSMAEKPAESMQFSASAGEDAIEVRFNWEKLVFHFTISPAE